MDNAKFLAITLVVLGHALDPLTGDVAAATVLFTTIYSFHMPVFVLIAGYLSRSFVAKPHQARRVITTLVVPYLVFEITFELFRGYLQHGRFDGLSLVEPSYAMWFLCALFFWRLSAPLWRAMKPTTAVGIAVAVSMVSAVMSLPEALDMYRTLGFLPFFVIGLVVPLDRYFAFVRNNLVRALAVPAIVCMFVATYLGLRSYPVEWLYFTHSYSTLGVGDANGILVRSVILAVAFVMLTAFFALAPRRRFWFTALGVGTLYVYLMHRFAVKGAEYTGLYDQLTWLHSTWGVAVVVVLSVLLTVLLASTPIRTVLRPLVEPRLDWLFQHDAVDRRDQ